MKKLVFLLLITYLLFAGKANAQTVSPTPTNTPTPTKDPSQTKIDKTIDLVASVTAKLKLIEKRGIIGQVTDVADTKITLSDVNNNTRFVDVDEFTKFSSPSAKEAFGISDIKKGDRLGILGLYNKQSRRVLARFVDVVISPQIVEGAVSDRDDENFTLIVVSKDKNNIVVDVENITKTLSYEKSGGLIRSGFSKIEEGERIMVVGFPDKNHKDRLIASRIIHFPAIPRNPKIKLDLEEPAVTPSTGSGKKLTPITR